MSTDSKKLHQLTVELKNGNRNIFIYESELSIQSYRHLFELGEESKGILASFDNYGLGLKWKDVCWYEVKIKD